MIAEHASIVLTVNIPAAGLDGRCGRSCARAPQR